jgi:hypothetical protein
MTKVIGSQIEKVYEETLSRHHNYLISLIRNGYVANSEIQMCGLVDACNYMLTTNLGLKDNIEGEFGHICEEVIKLVDKEEDKISALALISKLCSEMIVKITIADELKK